MMDGRLFGGKSFSRRGHLHSDATKKKIGDAERGEKNPNWGKKFSAETRAKMSAVRKGTHHTAETRAKMSRDRAGEKSASWGKHASPEKLAKMSEAAKRLWQDPAFRAKAHAAALGKHHSVEARAKMSAAQKGHPGYNRGIHPSESTRAKVGEAAKRLWQNPEHRERMSAIRQMEQNPNWRGGLSFIPYSTDWTSALKRSVRERDHYRCQLCGEPQGDRAFHVHHIDYVKAHCDPMNLVTLCHRCHGMTIKDREHWTALLQAMMSARERLP